ncbi:MAG: PilZ domain-containing protein [Bacillota bacterium]
MFQEKRRRERLNTYIPAELIVVEGAQRLCDYFEGLREDRTGPVGAEPRKLWGCIDNLSENGMRIVSVDLLPPGARISSNFTVLGDQVLSPGAVLIYSRIDGSLHYYGFRFSLLVENEQAVLKRFLRELAAETNPKELTGARY